MDEYNILRKKKRKNGFATSALLISLAVIIILVVIFVLLVGKINNKDNNSNNTSRVCDENGQCEVISCSSKEQVFNDNLRMIKDAAVSYFTNERLPQKVGEKKTLTLKKMQEEKLVLSVMDANGKACSSDDSYVEVTKEKNEYTMKIYLSCSDMKDYIIIHLGCYDYCNGKVCEKQEDIEEFEYEYKKTTSCTMSPWSSWSNWSTKKESTSNLKKEEKKTETVQKTVTETKNATKTGGEYTCASYGSDYKLSGTKCVKTTSDVKDATVLRVTYNCNSYSGYTLSGTKCVKTYQDVKSASKNNNTYSCASYGSDYVLSGTNCVKTYQDVKSASKNNSTYSCASYGSDYTLSGTNCVKTYQDVKSATPVKTTQKVDCYENKCTTKTSLDCSSGSCRFVPQESCEKVWGKCSKKVISGYSCNSYSGYTLSGTSCVKTLTDTKAAKVIDNGYNCNSYSGYTLSGTSCVKTLTDTKAAKVIDNGYNCNSYSGYTLSGTSCVKTLTDTKTATRVYQYTCNSYPGYTLTNDNKCVSPTDTKNAVKTDVVYTCPTGYNKSGTKCTRQVQKEEKVTYYRYATRTCKGGSTTTKWSTNSNDKELINSGYKKTGNKRKITVTEK